MFGCDLRTGGESGIRTHVTLSSKHAFQACAFSHSAISPANQQVTRIDSKKVCTLWRIPRWASLILSENAAT
jgi:hypothetical protein